MGLPHGKTEAWYVLSADPGAEVSLGLKHPVTPPQLRAAIVDGTIVDLTHRQVVRAGEAIVVSAGTIHAIGAGLGDRRDFSNAATRRFACSTMAGIANCIRMPPLVRPSRGLRRHRLRRNDCRRHG